MTGRIWYSQDICFNGMFHASMRFEQDPSSGKLSLDSNWTEAMNWICCPANATLATRSFAQTGGSGLGGSGWLRIGLVDGNPKWNLPDFSGNVLV